MAMMRGTVCVILLLVLPSPASGAQPVAGTSAAEVRFIRNQ